MVGKGNQPPFLEQLRADEAEALQELRGKLAYQPSVVLPFVGAGLSTPALPGWTGLLNELFGRLEPSDRQECLAAMENREPLTAASFAVRRFPGGEEELAAFLGRRFGSQALEATPRPSVYEALASLGPTQHLTTNYDSWLADAVRGAHGRVRQLTPRRGIPLPETAPDTGPFVLHLHGLADEPPTCVLTQQQYERLQFDGGGYVQRLRALFDQRRVLFLGTSLGDPDIEWILRQDHALLGRYGRHVHVGFALRRYERERLAQLGIAAVDLDPAGDARGEWTPRLVELLAWLRPSPVVEEESATSDATSKASMPSSTTSGAPPSRRTPDKSPFPGLRAYREEDAAIYFGREVDTERLLAEIARRAKSNMPWVQIEGASGTGKSSLARAGVLAAVRAGRLDSSGLWHIAKMRPGLDPLRNLALALRQALDLALPTEDLAARLQSGSDALRNRLDEALAGGGRLLLFVDQLEELVTLAPLRRPDPDDPSDPALDAFDANLAQALAPPEGSARLVLLTTVRRDFEGELRRLERLDRLLPKAHHERLRPIEASVLEQGIRRIADEAGLLWDPTSLPTTLAQKAAEEHSGLPLLAMALEGLWQERSGQTMRGLVYERWKDLGGALAARAEESFAAVVSEQGAEEAEERVRKLLLALVTPGLGRRDTRKLISRSELRRAAGGDEVADHLLTLVSGGRSRFWQSTDRNPPYLVAVHASETPATPADGISREDVCELAHERVLDSWARLNNWVESNRELLAWRDQLEAVASGWVRDGSNPRAVDTGPLLDHYLEAGSPKEEAQAYLETGLGLRRRKRWRVCALVMLGVLAFLGISYSQWSARRESDLDSRVQEEIRFWQQEWDLWSRPMPSEIAGARDPKREAESWSERIAAHTSLRRDVESRVEHLDGVGPRERTKSSATDSPAPPTLSAEDNGRLNSARTLLEILDRIDLPDLSAIAEAAIERRSRAAGEWCLPSVPFEDRIDALWPRGLDAPPTPRYDLYPLHYPAGSSHTPLLTFAMSGTGSLPTWDPHPYWHGCSGELSCNERGQWKIEPGTALLFAYVPEARGSFSMGSPAESTTPKREQPQRSVRLSAYYIGLHEFPIRLVEGESLSLPATGVDWHRARVLAEDLGASLPTEAQWECAARAGGLDPDEERLPSFAWFESNSEGRVHAIGTRRPNDWALFDMAGNAWEWCQDWYGPYDPFDIRDPKGPTSGDRRVLRGGSFRNDADWCRPSYRGRFQPGDWDVNVGFRVVLSASPSD